MDTVFEKNYHFTYSTWVVFSKMCKAFLVDDKRSKKETELQNVETLDGNGFFFCAEFSSWSKHFDQVKSMHKNELAR
jgi:hypothetical protein